MYAIHRDAVEHDFAEKIEASATGSSCALTILFNTPISKKVNVSEVVAADHQCCQKWRVSAEYGRLRRSIDSQRESTW
jgi:hypothetical protein